MEFISCCRLFLEIFQNSKNENEVCQRHFSIFQITDFSKKTLLKSFWLIKEQRIGELFKNFAEKDIEVYSKMSETNAAFVMRAIQFLKHIRNRYFEDHGKKFVPKLQQLVLPVNCRKKCASLRDAKT